MPAQSIDPAIAIRIQKWLEGPFDPETKSEIRNLLTKDPKKLSDAFFKDLSFGTGGMRGIMGIGTNRMNIYTVGMASQGLANYILKQPEKESGHSVFIGYDVRHNSKEFAYETARVLAANNIRVFITKEVSPTPLVSFGCRYYECISAVMITASHNPPEYNGFKAYWEGGCQVVPPHDLGIIDEVKKIHTLDLIAKGEPTQPLIHEVGEEFDLLYLKEIKKLQLLDPKDLHIVYTNLHGTGMRHLPRALKDRGFDKISFVEKQAPLDGDFPFAPKPNPEEEKTLSLGIAQLLDEEGDLLLATDPDADRVSAVVREKGKAVFLSGNQICCICLHHILERLSQKGTLPENSAFVKTIVTTELFRKIARAYRTTSIDVLTGFKYIGEKIGEWESSFGGYQYIFGGEESCGYLFGTYVRDKDAISSGCLIAEAASLAKEQNLTLIDRLHQLYKKYGIHREKLINIAFSETREGLEKMKTLMKNLRTNPPLEIDGKKVTSIDDYLLGKSENFEAEKETPIVLPKSDVLTFWLEDQTKVVIRPSGTEPKVKIYLEVVDENFSNIDQGIAACDERLSSLSASFEKTVLS